MNRFYCLSYEIQERKIGQFFYDKRQTVYLTSFLSCLFIVFVLLFNYRLLSNDDLRNHAVNQSTFLHRAKNPAQRSEKCNESEKILRDQGITKLCDYLFWKKWIDRILAFLLLILLSPVFLIIAISVLISVGRPIIFHQERIGFQGKVFTIYKFNKMKSNFNENKPSLFEEQRMTKLGKFLRNSSLDELPQLWNIFRGEMSFVGPRPILSSDIIFLNEEQKKRHTVRPGLTGLAQINGRNSLLWEDKFNFDLDYIQRLSLGIDLIICLKTILCVIKHKNVNNDINRIHLINLAE